MTLSNPWGSLKLKPLSPEQLARVLELVSRPIIDPPFHKGMEKYWDVKLTYGEEEL